MEGQAEHPHEEVDGIAGEVALGPAPVAVYDDGANGKGFLVLCYFSLRDTATNLSPALLGW